MPTTIVFDLDGTLIDTAPDLLESLSQLLVEEGLPPADPASARTLIGHGIRPMIATAFNTRGVPATETRLEAAWQRYLALYTPRMNRLSRPFDGVETALEALKARGYRLAICTNKLEALARQIIEERGWSRHFSALAGQDTYPWRKPDGRHILSVVEAAGGKGGRVVMVGDSQPDIAAARDCGVPVIGFLGGYCNVPLASLEPDLLLAHYDGLVAAVETVLSNARP